MTTLFRIFWWCTWVYIIIIDSNFFVYIGTQLRSEVNKILENARTGKLIGSSLDAKVYLHAGSSDTAIKLQELSSASNDADALHRLFITSQVKTRFPKEPFSSTST